MKGEAQCSITSHNPRYKTTILAKGIGLFCLKINYGLGRPPDLAWKLAPLQTHWGESATSEVTCPKEATFGGVTVATSTMNSGCKSFSLQQ